MSGIHRIVSILVPCHRVIGANGTLTGYAGARMEKGLMPVLFFIRAHWRHSRFQPF